MNFSNRTILHLAEYSAPYKGNFILSLINLEKKLNILGANMCYVFPQSASEQPWFQDFSDNHKVFLTTNKLSDAADEILDILKVLRPIAVHCHFDGYDKVTTIACCRYKVLNGNEIKQIWHLHNAKGINHHGWRKLLWAYRFAIHYGIYGKNVSIISVSNYMNDFSNKYHRVFTMKNFKHHATIPNGIDTERLRERENVQAHKPYTFLAHGGRNIQKRIDVLLEAAQIGVSQGLNLRILLTKGCDTKQIVEDFFNNKVPDWCQIIDPNDDICNIFDQADCFVSTSIHETFSYAICEATIYGLPIIQSDIDGTKWNIHNPSVFSFPSLDSEKLLEKMKAVMNTSSRDIINNCHITRERNISLYSIEHWVNNIISFYMAD